jgi:ATP-dependent Clp protease ATP-binding subunit ClpB
LYQREDEFCDKLNSRATFKGFTPLHYAALINDNLNILKILLDSNADPLKENDSGHRAIEYCAEDEAKSLISSYESIVCILIRFIFNHILT